MLNEMHKPLVPIDQYEHYNQLGFLAEKEEKIERIRELIDLMEPLHRNTLRFLIKFFKELISYERDNELTSYDVARNVACTIFRPEPGR